MQGSQASKAAYTAALAAIPDGEAKAQGIAVGRAAAAAILDLRAADGAVGPFLNFACPQDTDPGEYQCTPGTPFIAFRGVGERDALRPEPQLAVPPGAAVCGGQRRSTPRTSTR